MSYPTLCLLLTLAGGILSGPVEAAWVRYRIRRGSGKKLPHYALLALRTIIGGAYFVGLGLEQGIEAVVVTVTFSACLPAFALTHRVSFNLAHGQDWRYMGPAMRRDDDSAYDTFWHDLSASERTYFDHGSHKGKTLYRPRFPDAPFWAAASLEVIVLVAGMVVALGMVG